MIKNFASYCFVLAVTVAFVGASAATLQLAWAQRPPGPPAMNFSDYEPVTPGFQQATQAFRDYIIQLVEIEIRFNNSVAAEDSNRLREQWYDLREQGFELYQEMVQEALAEFLLDPSSDHPLADILFGVLKRNAENDAHEGLLPIALALKDHDYPAPELDGLLAMCCLADNEFDLARAPMERMIASGQAADQLVELYENLDELASEWQDELERRQRDAEGELLPLARVATTKGTFVIELFENDAPEAVANFISLAEQGFYRYSPFFMVLSNLMAQSGCPNADGTGGPGYFIPRESEDLSPRRIFRGSVALALLEDMPDSGGSQFMVTFLPVRLLEKQSRVFGRVVSGMHNVAKLNRIDPGEKKEEGQPAAVPDEIVSIEIIRKRDHAYEPTRLTRPTRED